MKSLFVVAAACASLCAALPASAQFAKPTDAITYRQSVMEVMATHFSRIGQMVQGRVPYDAKVAADNAALVLTMSKLPFVAFTPGTESGGNTKALPAIWSEADKFKTTSTELQDRVVKLDAAAKTGNLDQLKAAFGETGQSCKTCHDNFRGK
ncbi:cytochrome c [soil metagenome]